MGESMKPFYKVLISYCSISFQIERFRDPPPHLPCLRTVVEKILTLDHFMYKGGVLANC